jgi:hypothetical protein
MNMLEVSQSSSQPLVCSIVGAWAAVAVWVALQLVFCILLWCWAPQVLLLLGCRACKQEKHLLHHLCSSIWI